MSSSSSSRSGTSDARSQLLHSAEQVLRGALVQQQCSRLGLYLNPSHEADVAISDAVREVCDEAHRLDLRAEDMLVVVKQAWSHLAPVRTQHLGERDADVLREVVSTSIEVFFDETGRVDD